MIPPGSVTLAWRHMLHYRVRSMIIVSCVAVVVALPLAVRALASRFEQELVSRAASTPLLVGAKGNRFDLVMSMLYFRRSPVATISMADLSAISSKGGDEFIPLNVRFTARGFPIVATTPEYFESRGLRPGSGSLPLTIGDVTLGANVAEKVGLGPGSPFYSDQRDLFDLTKPQSLKMNVVGVLSRSHTGDDDAVFVDLKTAWILEGVSHAHADPGALAPRLVLERGEGSVSLSEEIIAANQVTPGNEKAFHLHASDKDLPLTGIIVRPESEKSATILMSRLNADSDYQAVRPSDVMQEILGYVLQLRVLLDGLAIVVGVLTAVLLGLITALGVRERSGEIATLSRIGVARLTIFAVFACEIWLLLMVGAIMGFLAAAGVVLVAPDLVKLL